MGKIQIAIPCGANSEKYVSFLIETIEKTVSGESELEYLFGISHSSVDKGYLDKISSKYSHRNINLIQNEISSYGHAATLDGLLKRIDSKYAMFIDCDVSMLTADWDVKMKVTLVDDVVIVGSEYVGNKYRGFPNVVVCMFKTNIIKDLGISFLSSTNKVIRTKEEASIYSREIGDTIFLDVGWELPYKIKKGGYSGCVMSVYNRNNKQAKFMTGGLRGTEYQLGGEVVASHVGRSLIRNFDTNDVIKSWKRKTNEWLS